MTVMCLDQALVGACNGHLTTFSNTYLAESAPAHLRRVCSGVLDVTTSVGGLLGTVVP